MLALQRVDERQRVYYETLHGLLGIGHSFGQDCPRRLSRAISKIVHDSANKRVSVYHVSASAAPVSQDAYMEAADGRLCFHALPGFGWDHASLCMAYACDRLVESEPSNGLVRMQRIGAFCDVSSVSSFNGSNSYEVDREKADALLANTIVLRAERNGMYFAKTFTRKLLDLSGWWRVFGVNDFFTAIHMSRSEPEGAWTFDRGEGRGSMIRLSHPDMRHVIRLLDRVRLEIGAGPRPSFDASDRAFLQSLCTEPPTRQGSWHVYTLDPVLVLAQNLYEMHPAAERIRPPGNFKRPRVSAPTTGGLRLSTLAQLLMNFQSTRSSRTQSPHGEEEVDAE